MMELVRFKILYAGTALFQALCMALWSDLLSLNYSLGFGLITGVSVLLSYFGSRSFVFR